MVHLLWLVPTLPLLACGAIALTKQSGRRFAAATALTAAGISFLLSCLAFIAVVTDGSAQYVNFRWFQLGEGWVRLGWILNPLTAVMLVTVSAISLLVFIYSLGYMAEDKNFTRFYCFLSLFLAAMLGLVIANSLLLFFICWELVGLASYLLIGFWYEKPEAAAAAKKAFIVTRIGDLSFLLGTVWLYSAGGTLLFYDRGAGCLEPAVLTRLAGAATISGLTISACIGLLIFGGAIGKSGQVPLHVWLPDAMEGPTPVSALIHAATMVAAGVFLVARMYPLMSAGSLATGIVPVPLTVITWVGAITALMAASIAVAQNDIKRILAYSTVSQLGYMMIGLGVGGVAVGMFHLVTHACFKALLFLGAGSVLHGAHHEQDIRRLGGLSKAMPVTFATYAVGMLALSGFPLFFSGFWSKDLILHAAHGWHGSHWPFFLGLAGALLTAFYMTRQVWYVFFGGRSFLLHEGNKGKEEGTLRVHESPPTMLVPLAVLGCGSVLLGFLGTPAWPWFQSFLGGSGARFDIGELLRPDTLMLMALSTSVVLTGLLLGCLLYGQSNPALSRRVDPLQLLRPEIYNLLSRKFYFDEIYQWSLVRLNASWSKACDWADREILTVAIELVGWLGVGFGWLSRALDEHGVNRTFDRGCSALHTGGGVLSRVQNGLAQNYLRMLALGVAALVLAVILISQYG